MKISLQLNGREVRFSASELISRLKKLEKLEEMYPTEEDSQESFESSKKVAFKTGLVVKPYTLDRALFEEKRDDFMQEWTRQAIIKAMDEVDMHPGKYSRMFAIFTPKKTWKSKTVNELKAIAKLKGDRIANWVELSLSWAQRISNGESWENVCNNPDTSDWYRLVTWRNNHMQIVGGSRICNDILPSTTVFGNKSSASDILHFTVPLIVIYL